MKQGLAAADGDSGDAELGAAVDAAVNGREGDGLGEGVVFVAAGAGEVAAPDRDEMGENGVIREEESIKDHAEFPGAPVEPFPSASERSPRFRHSPRRSLEHGRRDRIEGTAASGELRGLNGGMRTSKRAG